jgi:glyoxylate utilization-related uncharacterized protein
MTANQFGRRVVELRPCELLEHADEIWRHAIVFVVAGEIEVRCSRGERHCFGSGDVLSLARLPRASVRSTTADTRLVAIWRRAG